MATGCIVDQLLGRDAAMLRFEQLGTRPVSSREQFSILSGNPARDMPSEDSLDEADEIKDL